MNKKLLYYYFSRGYLRRLKIDINKKRNYIFDSSVEKYDFIFDDYKNKIIKKMLDMSELKRRSLKKVLKKKSLKNRIFKKIYIKALSVRIRNELLLTIPGLLYFHKKLKSWRIVKSYLKKKYKWKPRYMHFFKKRRKLLRNVKVLKIGYWLNYREVTDLRIKLNQMYFWLVNTTKRQIKTAVKFNRLKKTRDKIKNYFIFKKKFFKKKLFFLKRRVKLYKYFNKKKYLYYVNMIYFFFNFYKKLIFFCGFLYKNFIFYKFYFFKYIYLMNYFFKKSLLNKLSKAGLNLNFKEFKPLKKRKIRRRLKKKILSLYKILKYKNRKKIFKLKVRMVNSNFFITLTNYNDQVVISRSTGQVSKNRKKKVKLSPYLVARMMYGVLRKIKKLKIKYLFFFINTKINRHINNVMKSLRNFRYTKILKIFFSKPIAHHFGLRKPKLRRL